MRMTTLGVALTLAVASTAMAHEKTRLQGAADDPQKHQGQKGAQLGQGTLPLDEAGIFSRATDQRVQAFQDRLQQLDQASAGEPTAIRQDVQKDIREIKDELQDVRTLNQELGAAGAEQWIAAHDDIVASLAAADAAYERAVRRVDPTLISILLFPDPGARARAGERTEAEAGAALETSYPEYALNRLHQLEQVVERMESQGEGMAPPVQARLEDTAEEVDEEIGDTMMLIEEMRVASDPQTWMALHDDVEDSFDEMTGDLLQAQVFVDEQKLAPGQKAPPAEQGQPVPQQQPPPPPQQ